jgi:hypothetical protein
MDKAFHNFCFIASDIRVNREKRIRSGWPRQTEMDKNNKIVYTVLTKL